MSHVSARKLSPPRSVLVATVFAVTSAFAAVAAAHDGPEAVIARLNVALLRQGPSADLLFRRAAEYRALRQYERVAEDLNHSLRLNGDLEIARLELARLQFWALRNPLNAELGDPLANAEALTSSADPQLRTAAIALRGQVHLQTGNSAAAVSDFSVALQHHADVDWYLFRSQAQQQLGQWSDGIAGLREGLQVTASPVLRNALCDTLIAAAGAATAGQTTESQLQEATVMIEAELADSRFRSAWLIRRARVATIRGERMIAHADLTAAGEELAARLTTQRPDPALIVMRDEVTVLLGRLAVENVTSAELPPAGSAPDDQRSR